MAHQKPTKIHIVGVSEGKGRKKAEEISDEMIEMMAENFSDLMTDI